jgi:putative membrane protein
VKAIASILIGLVALSHIGFLVLEMFFWDHPVGRRIFGMTPEVSASSATLAANQGLYNGFLAAGLVWALWADRRELKLFFLGCVVVAGVFGGLTAKTSILFTQALPGRDRAGAGAARLEALSLLTPSASPRPPA